MKKLTVLFLALLPLLSSCVGKRSQPGTRKAIGDAAIASDYRLEVRDDPKQGRFSLTIKSLTQRPLCIERDSWPLDGRIAFAADYVYVEAPDRVLPVRNRNLGYPIPTTFLVIPSGGALAGYIDYSEFDSELSEYAPEERTLVFLLKPAYCEE